MTNDRQTVLGRVSAGTETHVSHHETVQLTELLPVERSRIEDNPDNTDQETTDGLRALRSFALGQHEHFNGQREFDCFRKAERSNCETPEGRTRLKKRKIINGDSTLDRGRVTTRSSSLENDGKSIVNTKTRQQTSQRGKIDKDYSETDTRIRDMTEELFDSAEEEVYYYRQQHPDVREALANDENENLDGDDDDDDDVDDDSNTKNMEIVSDGVYQDMADNFSVGSSGTKGTSSLVGSLKKKNKEKRDKKGSKKNLSLEPIAKVANGRKVDTLESEDAENHLRLKIDGIIQANYLLEQENNNVVHTNHNEIDPKCPSKRSAKEASKKEDAESLEGPQKTTKKYNCVMCDSSFKGSGGLRNHYKVVHAAGPSYKCDECGKEFPLKERLKLHVRTHTGFKPYKCPDCHKSFARGGQLVQHRGTHSKIKPYRCHLCTGTFTCAANLALHVKRHNGQKDHKCQICGRGFVRKDALKKHLECLHRDVKSFLCVICNKTFKGHLPQHMRTHAQDRPHGCATCGQRFAQKSQLTVHQRTHSGQRPFRCLVCWQAFAHSTALKLHTRRHTGERPFKCVECNAGFTQLPHWKKHMKCIHGRNEPYSCKNCNSFFRIKSDLESHEKACHCDSQGVDRASKNNDSDDASTSLDSNNFTSDSTKFRSMSVERMRLLLAVLLKRISRPERLDELGFGKRLIDQVLQDSLVSAGKEPSRIGEHDELESLRKNLETFLEWTVPKEHWERFRKINKTPEEILETLTAT